MPKPCRIFIQLNSTCNALTLYFGWLFWAIIEALWHWPIPDFSQPPHFLSQPSFCRKETTFHWGQLAQERQKKKKIKRLWVSDKSNSEANRMKGTHSENVFDYVTANSQWSETRKTFLERVEICHEFPRHTYKSHSPLCLSFFLRYIMGSRRKMLSLHHPPIIIQRTTRDLHSDAQTFKVTMNQELGNPTIMFHTFSYSGGKKQ